MKAVDVLAANRPADVVVVDTTAVGLLEHSLILGVVGGLLPALRAARLPVTTGLREL